MVTGSTLVRVVPNPDGGWDVREPGGTRALTHARTKDTAILRARTMMLNGGVVQVLDSEGYLLETYTVSGPRERPWWYIAPRRLSWVIGSMFVLQGVLQVAGRGIGEFRFWLGLTMGLLGICYLVMLVISYRRDRQLLQSEQSEQSAVD